MIVELDGQHITLEAIESVASHGARIVVNDEAITHVLAARALVERECASEGRGSGDQHSVMK